MALFWLTQFKLERLTQSYIDFAQSGVFVAGKNRIQINEPLLKFGWYLQLEECSIIWQSECIQIYSQLSQTPLTDFFTLTKSSEGNLIPLMIPSKCETICRGV